MSYKSYNSRPSTSGRRHFGPPKRGGSGGRGPKKENIHPSKYVKAAKIVGVEVFAPLNTFADFVVEPLLHTNLAAKNFDAPSPIQDQAIPLGLTGQDVIGVAGTGTGKTVAFAIPVLNKLLSDPQAKALIMTPTRELAQQIEDEIRALAKGSGLYGAILIGGTPMSPQLRDLSYNPRIVMGTPGRIKDHMERRSLDVSGFNMVVLDEVDRMLDMGFVGDMREILGQLAKPRQSFFFSATVDHKVNSLIQEFSNSPVTISVKTSETIDTVEQNIVTYRSKDQKVDKLHDLLISDKVSKALVFDDTQRSVERLSKELLARGFKSDAIHGGKSQGQRQRALNRFKVDEITVLVATDVAARGIDVLDISHVINFSTPKTYDDYVHRIGRAGRAGKAGFALTFVEG